MFTKKVLVSAMFAAGTIFAVATPLSSQAQVEVYFTTAPPAARYEVVPAPRAGYVWANGYYRSEGNAYVWTSGDWQAARPGYTYVSPQWVQGDGRWNYRGSRWDRDGDGIPNRRDAAPYDPNFR